MYATLQKQLSEFKEPDREKYGMHIWYPAIAQFTFHSTCITLTPRDIEDVLECKPSGGLLDRIDEVIKYYGGKVFPRLHYLSPKYLAPCESASFILGLLVGTTRTQNVLISHRDKGCPLFLREWVNFGQATEIRCFIVRGRLTCMSQNDSQADSEPLEHPQLVKSRVMRFIDTCLPHLPYKDCTVDVALIGKSMYIVEINTPFDMLAGSGLFSYPHEAELLSRGTPNGPILRYHTDAFYGVGEI